MGVVRNPDALLARDKYGYDRVLSNPVVKSELSTLFGPIVDSEIVVTGTGHEAIDAGLSELLNTIDGIQYAIGEMLPAYVTGARCIEIVWGIRRTVFGDMWLPVMFCPHNIQRFARDAYSGLIWMTQDGSYAGQMGRNDLIWTESGYPEYVPYGKLIWHTYRDGDGTYGYGWGEGINLYRWVSAFDAMFSFWVDYAQFHGLPWKVGKLDHEYVQSRTSSESITASDVADDFAQTLANMIENDTSVIDARNEIQLLMPPGGMTGASDFFRVGLDKISEMIRITITGESVTSTANEGGLGNSLAKAQEARAIRTSRQRRLSRDICPTLKRDLLDPILHFNRELFAGLDMNAATTMVRMTTPRISELERLDLMLKSPFPVHEDDFYRLSELRKPTPGEIERGETQTPALTGAPAAGGLGGF